MSQISGGADVAAAVPCAPGLVDELRMHVAPVLLGDGTRLFGEGGEPIGLEATRVYRRRRRRTSRSGSDPHHAAPIAKVTVRDADTCCLPGSTGATSAPAAARS